MERCTRVLTSSALTSCHSVTGDPKGVVLKHKTIVAAVQALHDYLEESRIEVTYKDSLLSFLPLAHIFGRVVEEFMISSGAKIGYWQVGRPAASLHLYVHDCAVRLQVWGSAGVWTSACAVKVQSVACLYIPQPCFASHASSPSQLPILVAETH